MNVIMCSGVVINARIFNHELLKTLLNTERPSMNAADECVLYAGGGEALVILCELGAWVILTGLYNKYGVCLLRGTNSTF